MARILAVAYTLLSNGIIQNVFSGGMALTIGILTAFEIWNVWTWAIIVVYLTGIALFTWVGEYNREKMRDLAWFKKSVESQLTVESSTSSGLIDLTKKALEKRNRRSMTLRDLHDVWSFQQAAFAACRGIYAMLSTEFKSEDHYITVYQRFSENDREKENVKMVAYWSKYAQRRPLNFMKPYFLEGGEAFFCKIFNSDDQEMRALASKEEVVAEFHFNENMLKREQDICQYIGIPIAIDGFGRDTAGATSGIGLLLQIDINLPGFFGHSKDEMLKKAYYFFYPYATFLHMAYEMGRFVDTTFDKWYINNRKKNQPEGKGVENAVSKKPESE